MRDESLKNRVALVTGAGHRVGRAIALRLAELGASLAVHYNHSESGALETAEMARQLGVDAEVLQADLYERAAADSLVTRAVERFGRLDVLVPSAANFDFVRIEEFGDEEWDRAIDLNLTAPVYLARAAREHLANEEGAIVFITCSSVEAPYKNYFPYTVAKGGLRHAMRVLSLELAPEIRVNSVSPGTVLPPPEMSDEKVSELAQRIPLRRSGSADDVAQAVGYLATAPFVTGVEINVDGGRHVGAAEGDI